MLANIYFIIDTKADDPKPEVIFKVLIRKFLLRTARCVFFCVEIIFCTTQTGHGISNVMKHEQITGAPIKAKLSRDIKHMRRSP